MYTVAIVGRPNVGKSTLFNRLAGKRLAIVDDSPGVTRDRREADASLGGLEFRVVDTAGLEPETMQGLEADMRAQTERALADADLVLFLIDARTGVTPLDEHFADWLRRGRTPVVVVANKCEGRAAVGVYEAFGLGLGDPVPISAEHGEGLADLYEALRDRMPQAEGAGPPAAEADVDAIEDEPEPKALQLAIVGRPNVGKSTLVNRLLGDERVLTGPEPGVTRDAIAIDWTWDGRPIRLIDTAGLRRRGRVGGRIERLSAEDTLRAVQYAHVVVLVLDAREPLERQDLGIARHVIDEGRALVVALNKWDLVEDAAATLALLRDRLDRSLPQVRGVAVVTVSALTGQRLDRLMQAVAAAYDVWNRRVSTGELNRWLADAVAAHPPPAPSGRALRIRYATQIKRRPPTFALFVSRPEEMPDSYLRYLANGMREAFALPGVPIRLTMRKGKNPYAG